MDKLIAWVSVVCAFFRVVYRGFFTNYYPEGLEKPCKCEGCERERLGWGCYQPCARKYNLDEPPGAE